MATQALYRRYRPRRFSEIKGQDHIVSALRNAVINGREGQAYLFSGPRGTGKTTSARVLAKVLNCENPVDGEPCCECPSCLAVEQGTSYDVHELDAASNNGVDAMRDLIEKASLGTPGRHRVYILDEVHMLSKGAEAALLKTLEEPPAHVVFVLATTDPHKVSETIRSRTQHLQFHLLPMDVLEEHVRWLAHDAGIELPDQAIRAVLQQGAGSARDTLSALELAASTGGEIAEVASPDEVVEALIERDPGRALAFVAHSVQHGRDPRTLTEDVIRHLRECFLSLMAPELVQLPAQRAAEVAEQASRAGAASIVRAMERLGEMLVEMRHAPDPRVLLDVALVQLTHASGATDVAELMARIDKLEKAVAAGAVTAVAPLAPAPVDATTGRRALGGRAQTARPPASSPSSASSGPTASTGPTDDQRQSHPSSGDAPTDAPAPLTPESAPASTPLTVPSTADAPASVGAQELLDAYETEVKPALRGLARAMFMGGRAMGVRDGALVVGFHGEPHRNRASEFLAEVEKALTASVGRPVKVSLVVDGNPTDADEPGGGDDNVVALKPPPPPADHEVDTSDLVDVPPEAVVTPIDRLQQAFPGSQLMDER